MEKVCIYGRVSTSSQNISTQLQVLRNVADKNSWIVVKEYLDDGISGTYGRDKRPSYNQMLEDNNRKSLMGYWFGLLTVLVVPYKTSFPS